MNNNIIIFTISLCLIFIVINELIQIYRKKETFSNQDNDFFSYEKAEIEKIFSKLQRDFKVIGQSNFKISQDLNDKLEKVFSNINDSKINKQVSILIDDLLTKLESNNNTNYINYFSFKFNPKTDLFGSINVKTGKYKLKSNSTIFPSNLGNVELESNGPAECSIETFEPNLASPINSPINLVFNENNTPSVSNNTQNNTPSVSNNTQNNTPSVSNNNTPSVSNNTQNNTPSVSSNNTPSVSNNTQNNTPSVSSNNTPSVSSNNTPSVSSNNTPSVSSNNTPSVSSNNTPSVSSNNTPSVSRDNTKNKSNNSPSVSRDNTENKSNNTPSVSSDNKKKIESILRNNTQIVLKNNREEPTKSNKVKPSDGTFKNDYELIEAEPIFANPNLIIPKRLNKKSEVAILDKINNVLNKNIEEKNIEFILNSESKHIHIEIKNIKLKDIKKEELDKIEDNIKNIYINFVAENYDEIIVKEQIKITFMEGSVIIILEIENLNDFKLTDDEKDLLEYYNFQRVFHMKLPPISEYEYIRRRTYYINKMNK